MSRRGRHHSGKYEDFHTVLHVCKDAGQRKARRVLAYVGCPTCGYRPHVCVKDPTQWERGEQLRREIGALMGVVRPHVAWPEEETL